MSYVTVSADVDIDEVIDSMSTQEKQDLVDELYNDGYVPKQMCEIHDGKLVSVPESFYQEAINKLAQNYHRLSIEEEKIIINIAKKF
jgi:hypothetical protein